METVTLKRAPAPAGVAVTQTGRYGLLGQAMLKNQQNALALFGARPLSLRESAVALNISVGTLRKWIHLKYIAALRVGRNGHFRIRPEEIQRLLRDAGQQGVSNV